MFWKNKKGLSYVELTVVIFIMMMITTVTIANMNQQGRDGELFVLVQKVISDIRLAQGYALSAKELDGDIPAGGWGIYFEEGRDHYSVFADKATIADIANYVCLLDCSAVSEENYRDFDNPDDTSIDRIHLIRSSDGVEVATSKISIVFEPPDPTIHFCIEEGDCDYDSVSIVFVNPQLDKREVTINFFGLVDTNEIVY